MDDKISILLVKKSPFTTVGQIKNTLQEVGISVSKSREDSLISTVVVYRAKIMTIVSCPNLYGPNCTCNC